ncbi:MAG: hypothetical protein VCC01_01090 [Candidatus Hydrogenedentota bacterium]
MTRFLYISSCLSLFLIPIISSAQENFTTILEREYPAQWFVCGPFESDLDQGIIEAVANAQVPLGRNDFMASRGGTKNVQPAHSIGRSTDRAHQHAHPDALRPCTNHRRIIHSTS